MEGRKRRIIRNAVGSKQHRESSEPVFLTRPLDQARQRRGLGLQNSTPYHATPSFPAPWVTGRRTGTKTNARRDDEGARGHEQTKARQANAEASNAAGWREIREGPCRGCGAAECRSPTIGARRLPCSCGGWGHEGGVCRGMREFTSWGATREGKRCCVGGKKMVVGFLASSSAAWCSVVIHLFPRMTG
jgi:hypothetical protein